MAKGPQRRTAKSVRWNASQVGALRPRSSAYTDPGQLGLQMLVREKRDGKPSRTWLLRFKWRGKEEPRIAIGHFPETTLDEARGEARRLRELATKGIDPRRAGPKRQSTRRLPASLARDTSASSKFSVDYLVSEFVARHLAKTRKHPEYAQRILTHDVLEHWHGRDARTIEPHEVIELTDRIVERGSPVMANRVAGLLGQMFLFGVHRQIVKTSPVQLLYRPGGREKPRQRTLTEAELKAFLADPKAATRYARLAHAITVLLLTGQRRGELAVARWDDIRSDARTWTIRDEVAKGGRGHVVPLTDWAVREFQALQRLAKRSTWVLPANGGEHHIDPKQLTRSVAKCLQRFKERGIGAFTLHDLRRTCRTGLARVGVAPHIAERVLNHAQERIPGTYDVHDYLEEKRAALEKWAMHLQALCS
jgi:integrase